MTDNAHLDSILKAALRAFLATRCERAYIHELRNSLQGVYVSVDLTARFMSGKAGSISSERVVETARRAIQSHEQAAMRTLQYLTGPQETPGVIDAGTMLQAVASFMNNDAAARGVRMQIGDSNDVWVAARADNLRLVFLSVLVHAIDTVSDGGEISVNVSNNADMATIDFYVFPATDLSAASAWDFGDDDPIGKNWVLGATRRLAQDDGGDIESGVETLEQRQVRTVRIRYQAAKSSSLVSDRSREPPVD